jgi:hypothetical protein
MRAYHLAALALLAAAGASYILAWKLTAVGFFGLAVILESFAWAHLLVGYRRARNR